MWFDKFKSVLCVVFSSYHHGLAFTAFPRPILSSMCTPAFSDGLTYHRSSLSKEIGYPHQSCPTPPVGIKSCIWNPPSHISFRRHLNQAGHTKDSLHVVVSLSHFPPLEFSHRHVKSYDYLCFCVSLERVDMSTLVACKNEVT